MKKIIPIIFLFCSFVYLQDEQPFPPLDLISIPTAGTLPKGMYAFETLLHGEGNILPEFLIGITNNFSIGFSFGLQGFVGTGDIKKNKSAPEINIKYRIYEETETFPALTIKFNSTSSMSRSFSSPVDLSVSVHEPSMNPLMEMLSLISTA